MRRKPDADAISVFIDELASQPWLDSARSFWPKYVFHVTDVKNAASILATGQLLCRSRAASSGLMLTENASPEIIAQTSIATRDQVRLYFRPRTPTFFHNEGIRPRNQRSMNASCPMPIAFLFDSKEILSREGSRFSDGSLASARARIGSGVSFLREMSFDLIYHDRWFTLDEREEIVFRRQAEVIVEDELSLGSLRYVYTRSVAEYETLQSLLRMANEDIDSRITNLVRVNSRAPLFGKRWTYLESVSVALGRLSLSFNSSTTTPGPFDARFEIEDLIGTESPATGSLEGYMANHSFRYRLPSRYQETPFRFRLLLDDCLAYQNEFNPSLDDELIEVPF